MSAAGDARKFAKAIAAAGLDVELGSSGYTIRRGRTLVTRFSLVRFGEHERRRCLSELRRHGVQLARTK